MVYGVVRLFFFFFFILVDGEDIDRRCGGCEFFKMRIEYTYVGLVEKWKSLGVGISKFDNMYMGIFFFYRNWLWENMLLKYI